MKPRENQFFFNFESYAAGRSRVELATRIKPNIG